MTLDEAIDMLYGIRADNLNLNDTYTKDKYDALDMAIKALEQELCVDVISRQAVLDLIEHYNSDGLGSVFYGYEEGVKFADAVNKLPPVTPQPKIAQPKIGRWVYRIYGGFHEQGDWYCSHCDYQYNYGNGHAKFCPECGYEMSEAPTEEVIGDRDYDWVIKR